MFKEKETAQIKVFVTSTRKFRAKIKETKDSIPYEVTIGGKSWNEGKGREFDTRILKKCEGLLKSMKNEFYSLTEINKNGKQFRN